MTVTRVHFFQPSPGDALVLSTDYGKIPFDWENFEKSVARFFKDGQVVDGTPLSQIIMTNEELTPDERRLIQEHRAATALQKPPPPPPPVKVMISDAELALIRALRSIVEAVVRLHDTAKEARPADPGTG